MSKRPLRVLFQGDSITDGNRDRDLERPELSTGLGNCYVSAIARDLEAAAPGGFHVLNRGISGQRVVDLYARWKTDAFKVSPDLISILVGVNDTWAEFKRGEGVEVPRYAKVYRMLLEWTREVLPDVRLVLCEPFVLPCGVVEPHWRTEIDERRAVVRRLAADFGAILVPFQEMFDAALRQHPAEFYAADGVHPTEAGHELMGKYWIETTRILG